MDAPRRNAEVKIMKEMVAVSLNPDGRVNLSMDKKAFLEAISSAFNPIAGECTGNCDFCLNWSLPDFGSLKDIYDKGILNDKDLTSAQLKLIKSIRG